MTYVVNLFDWDVLGRYIVSMILQSIVFFTFNLTLHYQVFPAFFRRKFQVRILAS